MTAMVFMMAEACSDSNTRKPSNRIRTQKQVKKPVAATIQKKVETIEETAFPIAKVEKIDSQEPAIAGKAPEVMSMTLCSQVVDREPADDLTSVDLGLNRIYTHTAISNEVADTIYHVYKFENNEIAKVALYVGESPRWRTWSSKYLDPAWVGDWVVEVQTGSGRILDAKKFVVIQNGVEETPETRGTLSSM